VAPSNIYFGNNTIFVMNCILVVVLGVAFKRIKNLCPSAFESHLGVGGRTITASKNSTLPESTPEALRLENSLGLRPSGSAVGRRGRQHGNSEAGARKKR